MPDTENSIEESGIPEIAVDMTPQSVTTLGYTLQTSNVITQPTDNTLSVEGQPADAKAVGDAIAELQAADLTMSDDIAAAQVDISDLQETAATLIPQSDIETTLTTAGKVADSKATGDAIAAARTAVVTQITGMIDTTLSTSGGIADAAATGAAITDAIETAQTGVVFSVEGITPDSLHNVALDSLVATVAATEAMVDEVLAGT